MEIRINGKQAWLKKGTSIEYISENRLFTGSDSYTLSITFPLRGCQPNIDIFGHIHRKDVEKNHIRFDCDIRDGSFFKSGTITITEISEVEVKTQFLEGRSEQNFDDSFDELFINELDLGFVDDTSPTTQSPADVMLAYPNINAVALPWVNNTSGNLQNEVVYDENTGLYSWKSTRSPLSFQPYLIHIIKMICEATGYSYDLAPLEQSVYRHLIVCNALPAAWGSHNFAHALPHWTVTEFFEQLELLLYGEFTINHKLHHVRFDFTKTVTEQLAPVNIEKVVNEYTTEVSQEDSAEYFGLKNLAYADNDNRFWAYRSCEWYIRKHKDEAMQFDTLMHLLQYAAQFHEAGVEVHTTPRGTSTLYTRGFPRSSEGNKLFYCQQVDTYFIMFCYKSEFVRELNRAGLNTKWYKYYYRLEPVNQFGRKVVDEEADDLEIQIVPAWLDDTEDEKGQVIFLNCGELENVESLSEEGNDLTYTGRGNNGDGTDIDYNDGALAQSTTGRAIAKGEQKKADAFFDNIFVAFWDGRSVSGKQPHPLIDTLTLDNQGAHGIFSGYSLRLDQKTGLLARSAMTAIDGKVKYYYAFLADEIPDPRAVFHIRGANYLCEKLTCQFTEQGRSELIKGVFYRIV